MEKSTDRVEAAKATNENMTTHAERASSSNDSKLAKDDVAGNVADLGQAVARGLQPPDIIARLTPEERIALEKRLVKKIDWRLLPMIIIMCK